MSQDLELAKPSTVPMEHIAAVNAFEVYENAELFGQLQRAATLMSRSQLVPKAFQGEEHIADCFVVLGIARATGQDPLMLFQSLYVANGRAGWYAKYAISRTNASGIFEGPIRFTVEDLGEIEAVQKIKTGWDSQERKPTYREAKHKVRNLSVTAYATLKQGRGDRDVKQTVTMQMASDDGWTQNEKYFTIPQRMLEWRAASWLINLYCPHVLFGLPTAEEIQDVTYEVINDPVERVVGRPQVADYAPQEGDGEASAPAATTGTAGGGRGARGRRSATKAASPPHPPVDVQDEGESAGTVGGAQIEGDDGAAEPQEERYHLLTIVNAAGADFTYKIPDQQEKALSDWTALVNSLKGAGYAACEKVWNANVAEVKAMGEAGWPGLHRTMQDAISGMAHAEKAREKAEAKAAGQREVAPDPTPEAGDSSTGYDAGTGDGPDDGERQPMDFVTADGEVHTFEDDDKAVKWLHTQITTFATVDDLDGFYESNQDLMDALGFGPVVGDQRKALAKPKGVPPTATPAASAKKFHPAVRPMAIEGDDPKLYFTSLTKILDELRDNGGKAEDYAEVARLNEAAIGLMKEKLASWFKAIEKRFAKEGVKV